ncbi:zeta toxin family protein [Streptomyces rubradiris]|uniref:zeta toxin family protein n=1 Tax=Streptomyces rubradiris TaxID=285531 RepID=UPI003408B262
MRPGTAPPVGDDFRASHPDCQRLLGEGPRRAGATIRHDYRGWFAQAEAYVRRQRGDVLIEGVPGSVAESLASAPPFAAAGYPVEPVVLAVRETGSLLATALRPFSVRGPLPAFHFTRRSRRVLPGPGRRPRRRAMASGCPQPSR